MNKTKFKNIIKKLKLCCAGLREYDRESKKFFIIALIKKCFK